MSIEASESVKPVQESKVSDMTKHTALTGSSVDANATQSKKPITRLTKEQLDHITMLVADPAFPSPREVKRIDDYLRWLGIIV